MKNSEDPQIHHHSAEIHRKAAEAYSHKAREAAALNDAKAWDHANNMRHYHSEQMTFSKRRAEGLDPETGRHYFPSDD